MKEYLISTKADTLADLREIVKHSYIEELSIVYAEDFFGNPAGVIAAIKEQFTGEMIVVRSSSKSEDNLETSNAGHFESVLGSMHQRMQQLQRQSRQCIVLMWKGTSQRKRSSS